MYLRTKIRIIADLHMIQSTQGMENIFTVLKKRKEKDGNYHARSLHSEKIAFKN